MALMDGSELNIACSAWQFVIYCWRKSLPSDPVEFLLLSFLVRGFFLCRLVLDSYTNDFGHSMAENSHH